MAVKLELFVFIGGIFTILLCLYTFCCYLPRLPQDDWGYYDRTRIADNQYVTGNAGRETRADYPDQMRAVERMNRILDNVIEKEVIMSTKPSNRKSNIRIPFITSLRNSTSHKGPGFKHKTLSDNQPSHLPSPLSSSPDDAFDKDTAGNSNDRRTSVSFEKVVRENFEVEKNVVNSKHNSQESERKSDIPLKTKHSIRDSIRSTVSSIRSSIGSAASNKSIKLYSTERCFICLENYKVGDKINWSPNDKCIHSFHSECMFRWLMFHDECPLCKQDYLLNSAVRLHITPP